MEIRREAITINQQPDHVQVNLMSQTKIERDIEPSQVKTFYSGRRSNATFTLTE